MWSFKNNVFKEWKNKQVIDLIKLLSHEKATVRETSIKTIMQIGTRAVEPLCTALTDKRYAVRQSAAEMLAKIGDDNAVEPLCTALKDNEFLVRLAAVKALEQIGDNRAVEALCNALTDKEYLVRKNAVSVLEQFADKCAVESLCIAIGDEFSDIRKSAIRTLEQIGDTRAVEPLCIALNDKDLGVRKAAAEALEKIGIPEDPSVQVLSALLINNFVRVISLGSAAVEPLCRALKKEDRIVRRAAAEALGKIGIPEDPSVQAMYALIIDDQDRLVLLGTAVVEPLCKALEDVWAWIHAPAAKALGQIGDTRAVEPLCIALKSMYFNVREAAAEALGKLGDTRAVKPLCNVLKGRGGDVQRSSDGSEDARIAAARALEKIGLPEDPSVQVFFALITNNLDRLVSLGSEAVEPLCKGVGDAAIRVRQTAVKALVQIGDTRAVEPLCNALKDPFLNIAEVSATALGRIGDARSVEPLCNVFKVKDWKLRKAAAGALGQIGDTRAVGPLCNAIKHTTISVRMGENVDVAWEFKKIEGDQLAARKAAAKALGQIGDDRAVKPLNIELKEGKKLCEDNYSYKIEAMSIAAIEALEQIGGILSVEPLCDALKYKNSDIQQAAARVLGKIGDVRAVEPLCNVLKDGKANSNSIAAIEALGKIGDTRAVEPLCTAIKYTTVGPICYTEKCLADLTFAIAKALGQINDNRALGFLRKALKNPDMSVRKVAAEALKNMGYSSEEKEGANRYS